MSSMEGPGRCISPRQALLDCTGTICVTASTRGGRCSLSSWTGHESWAASVLTQQAAVIDGLQPERVCQNVGLSASCEALLACKNVTR